MRITALEPQEHHPERLNVFVDGEFRCGLAADIVLGEALRVGQEVTEERLAALERSDLLWKTREAALNLLSYRARTEEELRRRLLRKEYPEDVVEECLAGLLERGFLDDEAFAATFVRDRVRLRPRGTRRLVQELRAKGVDGETAETAVAEVFDDQDVSEAALAREAAESWARRSLPGWSAGSPRALPQGDERWAARRRLYGFLARRGFRGDAARRAMDAVFGAD